MTLNITDAELHEWAKMRADDAGRLARELVACRLQSQAAVAAAYEAAAQAVGWEAYVADTSPQYLSDWQRGLVAGQQAMCKAIRALATPDQIAALAAVRAATVTVKPLEWDDRGYEWAWWADTVLGRGTYQIRCEGGIGYLVDFDGVTIGEPHDTLEAAKAAAQADYDARIRSAITITSGDAEITRLRAVIVKDAAQMIDDQHKMHKAVEALRFYANGENWMINGPLDGNSGNYTGGPAKAVLAEIGGA